MGQKVKSSVADGIAFLVVQNPPSNVLSAAVRQGLANRLDLALRDPAVRQVVLLGHGQTFPAGNDLSEENTYFEDGDAPSLSLLCQAVEDSPKPVIAALHGSVFGGGLELALAAHYRIADSKTKVGFPDVKLGLMPGGGGTQRAPRILGAKTSLDLMLSGLGLVVTDPHLAPMIDKITGTSLAKAALQYCRDLEKLGAGPRRTRDRTEGLQDFTAYNNTIQHRRKQTNRSPETAPKEIVSSIEAAMLLPFEAGLEFEELSYQTCIASDQSAALRHAFDAERRCFHVAHDYGEPDKGIEVLAVLGGGHLAQSFVEQALECGLTVNWGIRDPDLRRDSRTSLLQALGRENHDTQPGRLQLGDSEVMAQGADIAILAAPGQSGVPIPDGVHRFKTVPGRVQTTALRFSTPVRTNRLVEIIAGPGSDPAEMAAAVHLVRRLRKLPVAVKSSGFSVSDRLSAACFRASDSLVDLGASPFTIDAALFEWGWTRPPFLLRDMMGLEATARFPRAKGCRNWSGPVIGMGRMGRTVGAGFYDHPNGKPPKPSVRVQEQIDKLRAPTTRLTDEVIVSVILGALANEGARMFADQWAESPSDIDVVALLGMDFPRWRGGPMQAADQAGLFRVASAMKSLSHPDRPFWTPHSLIIDLIKEGRKFSSLNAPLEA